MTAATTTLPGDLSGLIIEHAQRLERASRDGVRGIGKLLTPTAGLFQRAAARAKVILAVYDLTNSFRQLTATMADATIWFRGLRATIEDGTTLLYGGNTDMLDAMDAAQRSMRDLRSVLVGGRSDLASPTFAHLATSRRVAEPERGGNTGFRLILGLGDAT